MKLKNIIRIVTLLPLSLYLIYCSFYFITHKISTTYEDCGTIMSKSNNELVIKYGTKTELYLNIQFNNSGFRSIKCEPTLYFSKQVGQNVCIDLYEDVTTWHTINYFIGIFVIIAISFISLFFFIFYIIPDSWKI